MPALPKIGHARSDIGVVEVFRERKTEDVCQSQRHIGIAGEIEIQLHRVADGGEPRQPRVDELCGEDSVHHAPDDVGNEQFFGQADHEPPDTLRRLFGGVLPVVDLRRGVFPAQDRAGEDIWEERDEQRRAQGVFCHARGLSVDLDDIADGREREKRHAEGKSESGQNKGRAEKDVYVSHEEIQVFICRQNTKVIHYCDSDQKPAEGLSLLRYRPERQPCRPAHKNG